MRKLCIPHSAVTFGLASLILVACKSPPRESNAPASDPAESATTTPAAVAPAPKPKRVRRSNRPATRWRGPSTCVEVFENGDAEITLCGTQPQVLIMGRGELTQGSPDDFSLSVSGLRFWKARTMDPTKEIPGSYIEAATVLGTPLSTKSGGTFTMQKTSDNEWKFCGTTCEDVEPDEPLLGARWLPTETTTEAGAFADVDLTAENSRVAIQGTGGSKVELKAKIRVTSTDKDLFRIELTPAQVDREATGELLGLALEEGRTITIRARRLADQKLELCGKQDRCQSLTRVFDAQSYDIR